MDSTTTNVLAAIGGLTTLRISYSVIESLYFYFLRPSSLPRYLQNPHSATASWALVTGASDGIGLALAHSLASRGFNLALHGRNASKLEGVVSSLKKSHPSLETLVLVADASSAYDADASSEQLAEKLSAVPLTVIIHNVGGTQPLGVIPMKPLTEWSAANVDSVLALNARFGMQLTRALLPQLRRSSTPSIIINISSAAARGVPFLVPYAGSKGCVESSTLSLAAEMVAEGANVDAMCVVVGAVRTASQDMTEEGWDVPSSSTMAEAILARVGCGKAVVAGYWGHALQMWVAGLFPESLFRKIVANKVKGMIAMREEKLKKGL